MGFLFLYLFSLSLPHDLSFIMQTPSDTFTTFIASPKRIVTPVRLINSVSHREVLINGIWDTGAEHSAILQSTSLFLDLYTPVLVGVLQLT